MDDAAAAPGLAVGALLNVVGAQPHVALVGEVQVGQRVRLGLLEHLGGPRAEAPYPVDRQLVQLPDQLRVPLGEHGLRDAEDRTPLLPRGRAGGSACAQRQ